MDFLSRCIHGSRQCNRNIRILNLVYSSPYISTADCMTYSLSIIHSTGEMWCHRASRIYGITTVTRLITWVILVSIIGMIDA